MTSSPRTVRVVVLSVLTMAVFAVLLVARACTSDDASTSKKATATTTPQRSASMPLSKVLSADLNYSKFNDVVAASGLSGELDAMKSVTILVPSNAAMDALGADDLQKLNRPDAAAAFVHARALDGSHSVTQLLNAGGPVADLGGTTWTFAAADGVATAGGARFSVQDIATRNGYVHVIDGVGAPS